MVNKNTNTLKKKIEKQRKQLEITAENKRIDDKEVLKESEKLDKLINQYYKHKTY